MCGDCNARSSMWDQQGNNLQGNAPEESSGDVMCNPVITLLPTRLGSRHGDTESTIDLALVSPRISPWMSEETLSPHGSYHPPVVFSLQKPAKKRNVKPNNPFRYVKSDSDVVPKLRKRKLKTQSTKGSRKSEKLPPWWDSETEKAWTEKRAAVKTKIGKKDTSTKPRPNAQNNNGRQNRAVKKGSKKSKMENL